MEFLTKAQMDYASRPVCPKMDIDSREAYGDAIRRNFAVRKVSSSRRKNKTIIRCREPLDLEELKRVIGSTGYQLQKVEVREL